jgi:hypothetical protein
LLGLAFPEPDPNARVYDGGNPTVIGCERVNSLFAFQLISVVSRPNTSQIMFENRARLLVSLIISDKEILFAFARTWRFRCTGWLKVNAFERFSVGNQQLDWSFQGAVKSTRFLPRASSIFASHWDTTVT